MDIQGDVATLLPDGLVLNEQGLFSGAQQAAGQFPCTVQLIDRWGARTQLEITIEVSEPPEPNQQGQQEQQPSEGQESEGRVKTARVVKMVILVRVNNKDPMGNKISKWGPAG